MIDEEVFIEAAKIKAIALLAAAMITQGSSPEYAFKEAKRIVTQWA